MTLINLSDLIEDKPSVIPEGVIPYFDGCKWGLFDLGTLTGEMAPCSAVQACIDDVFIASIMSSGNGTIAFNPDGTVDVLANQVIALANPSIDCSTGEFSIGNEVIDLSCIADLYSFNFTNGNHTIQVSNGTSIFVRGFDGLRFNTWANELHIGLPTGAEPGQVLTWNGAGAYWTNGCETCCEFIQDCMSGTVSILQNQINLLSNLIGGGGGGGGIESIVAGDRILIDDTDPQNPVVSSNELTVVRDLTPAELNDMNANPIVLVAAPGHNKFVRIVYAAATFTSVTQNYRHGVSQNDLYIQAGSSNAIQLMSFNAGNTLWTQSGYAIKRGSVTMQDNGNDPAGTINEPLVARFSAVPAGGDSLISLKVVYAIEDL